MKVFSFFIISILLTHYAFAQSNNSLLRKGNSSYDKSKFAEAEALYNKALSKIPKSMVAHFNKGNAQYRQNANEKAAESFENAAKNTVSKNEQSNAYYNKGNAYANAKSWEKAIESYKSSLRKNPNDQDAKYNLSYAMKMLKNEQKNKKDNKDKDKNQDKKDEKDKQEQNDSKDKKDENKDEKKGDENKDNNDNNKDENGKNDEQKQEGKNQPKPQPKISKEEAERILQALQAEDQKTQDKVNGKLIKGVKVKNEQNW